MAWFKVDDGLHASRKLLSIPRTVRLSALGLWTMAGSWSAHEELDGFIPSFMLKEWGGTPRLVRALVESGLWVEIKDGAQFHNWAEYQPTRAELEEGRERERVRKAEYRKRTKDGGVPAGHQVGHEVGHQVVSEDPDPTRPDPTPYTSTSNEVEVPRKRATRIPEPFIVTAKMRTEMANEFPTLDIDLATKQFVDYWRAASGRTAVKKEWVAAWRFWMRKDANTNGRARVTPTDRAMQTAAAGRAVAGRLITTLETKEIQS